MEKLLYIQASPRLERSRSIAVSNAFVEAYKEENPGDQVITLNLFLADLPQFDGHALEAKYNILHGREHTEEDAEAWRSIENFIEEFTSADKYVLAVPMWNFLIPYRLKHYLDIIVQPGYTFRVDEKGQYEGLVRGKPLMLVCSRGGEYLPGTETEALDFQTPYLTMIMGFIGFQDIRTIKVEPTLAGGPERAEKRVAQAVEKARAMAGVF